MPPKGAKAYGKHADPHPSKKNQQEDIAGITPIQIPEDFVSPSYWHAAVPAGTTGNVFSAWEGQIPQNFPTGEVDDGFLGGGGASRSFDINVDKADDETPSDAARNRFILSIPDLRTEREERLNILPALISRDLAGDDVAIHRLDGLALDSIPIDEFFTLLTETSFVKRESMLKKDQQRARGDAEIFLDGESVDVPSQYKQMLDRIVAHLEGEGSKKSGLELPAIKTEAAGRRTIWVNFQEICQTLHRNPEEVRSFVCNELTTQSKYDGENRLHVDAPRLTPPKLQKLVIDFAMSHVYCTSCRGFDTKLVRDTALRLDLIVCNRCGCKRSVEGQSGGFVAIANRRGRLRARALA